jgi:hypothetical protein
MAKLSYRIFSDPRYNRTELLRCRCDKRLYLFLSVNKIQNDEKKRKGKEKTGKKKRAGREREGGEE